MKKTTFTITILFVVSLIMSSCEKEEILTTPTLKTIEITDLTGTTATCGGEITNNGGAKIISKGICWSTHEIPTINDFKSISQTTENIFTNYLTGLTKNTTYFARAYATNSEGTAYGNTITFTTNSTEPTIEDEIKILSITPTTGLIDGEYVTFTVKVSYKLITSSEGTLDVGFNNDEVGIIYSIMIGEDKVVSAGSGEHTFIVTAKVKDWGIEGDFHVYVNLSEGATQSGSWSPLASDDYVLISKH